MLGRISVVVAASAVLGLGALPASAATAHPWRVANLSGVVASGYWSKAHGKVTARVCVKNTGSAQVVVAGVGFAATRGKPDSGAVANGLGHGKTVCKTFTSTKTYKFVVILVKGTRTHPTSWGKTVTIY